MSSTWTSDLEEATLKLWFESKVKYDKSMKKDKDKRIWMLKKMIEYEKDAGRSVAWLEDFNEKQLKNKLDYIRRTGKRLLREHVFPLVRAKAKKTGSANDSEDESSPHLSDGQWDEILKACNWRCLKVFYELFRDHPTLGFGFSVDSVEDGDDDDDGDGSVQVTGSKASGDLKHADKSDASTCSLSEKNSTSSRTSTTSAMSSVSSLLGPAVSLPDDEWNSSTDDDLTSSDEDVKETPKRQMKRRRPSLAAAEPTAKKEKLSPAPKPTRQANAVSTHVAGMRVVMADALDAQDLRTQRQVEVMQEENRRQREHEVAMAERAERHSSMLQGQMMKTTAEMQVGQQTAQVNNLKSIMEFQANLLKGLFNK